MSKILNNAVLRYSIPYNLVNYLSLPFQENFSSAITGTLPPGWQEWDNLGLGIPPVCVVATSGYNITFPGTPNAITTGGARLVNVWYSILPTPADVQVTANMICNSEIDSQVGGIGILARGSNLNSSLGNAYAIMGTTYGEFGIASLNSGILNPIASGSAVPGSTQNTILNMTIQCTGPTIKGQVLSISGANAGNYLQTDFTWATSQAWCFDIVDSGITTPGYFGFIKRDPYSSSDYVTSFNVLPAGGNVIPPNVSITSPSNNAHVSGTIAISANATDQFGMNKVQFLLDGANLGSVTNPPYTLSVSTLGWPNSWHTISAKAFDIYGNTAIDSIAVSSINNTVVNRPNISFTQPQVKSAQLAYATSCLGSQNDYNVAKYIDVSVVDTSVVSTLLSIKPTGLHMMYYVNISNIYTDTMMDFLNYCYSNNIDPELGFFHAAQPFNYTIGGANTLPVIQPWSLFTGSGANNFSSNLNFYSSRDSLPAVLPNQSGYYLYFGYPEKFRQISLTGIQTAANSGWSYTLEYPTYTNPITWSGIPILTDGTNGLTKNGIIDFDVPSGWVPTSFNINYYIEAVTTNHSYYYVRFNVHSSGVSPYYTGICGRDYIGGGYGVGGTWPVFDSASDSGNKGYLNANEYATRAAGKDAYFKYESRLPSYGAWRLQVNLSNQAIQNWTVLYNTGVFNTYSEYNGLFVDNCACTLNFAQSYSVENISNYASDTAATLNQLWQAVPPHSSAGQRWLLPNVGGASTASLQTVVQLCPAYYSEFGMRPPTDTWVLFEGWMASIPLTQSYCSPEPIGIYDTFSDNTIAGRQNQRNQYGAYVYYNMGATTGTFLNIWGGEDPEGPWQNKWCNALQGTASGAFTYDIGLPSGTYSVLTTGQDPANTGLLYKIYQRQFTKAYLLYKPISYANNTNGNSGDASATTITLSKNYQLLTYSGTLNTSSNQVTLRNGEGAILI